MKGSNSHLINLAIILTPSNDSDLQTSSDSSHGFLRAAESLTPTSTPRSQHVMCVASCGRAGIASNLGIYAWLYQISQELNVTISYEDRLRDADRPRINTDRLSLMLPKANYYPHNCDSIVEGYHWCPRPKGFNSQAQTAFYEVGFKRFLLDLYSDNLKGAAIGILKRLVETHPGQELIGAHIRADNLWDGRQMAGGYLSRYISMISAMMVDPANVKILLTGDRAIYAIRQINNSSMFLEEFVQQNMPTNSTRAEVILISAHVQALLPKLVINKFSNHWWLRMAFVSAFGRKDISIGEVHSMRIQRVDGHIIAQIGARNHTTDKRWDDLHLETSLGSYSRYLQCVNSSIHRIFFTESRCAADFVLREVGRRPLGSTLGRIPKFGESDW